jgi:CO/xanthine dehydrogenase FAD-binding subunit
MVDGHWCDLMSEFDYIRADTLPDALVLLNETGTSSRVLAGGTDLMVQRRRSQPTYDRLIDISRIDALHVIAQTDSRITLGAGVTFREVLESPLLRDRAPLLVDACAQIGGVQIRNRGTVGGNVANAAACADAAAVLVCLAADAIILTVDGEQRMAVADLLTGAHQTALPAGAIIRAFSFAAPSDPARTTYERLARRQAMTVARLSVAVCAALDASGRTADLRIVAGAAFPSPRRIPAAEAALLGHAPSAARIDEAADCITAELLAAGERWSTPYKQRVLPALAVRALRRVLLDS